MDLRSKYSLPPHATRQVLGRLRQHVLDLLPTKAITSQVIVDEFYASPQVISIQRVYSVDQLQQGKLVGKPRKIFLIKGEERSELGFTSVMELQKIVRFLDYKLIGSLSQIRTGFLITDDLIEIPVILNETNELGAFIEIGSAAGPPTNLTTTLDQFQDRVGIANEWIQYNSYHDLIQLRGTK